MAIDLKGARIMAGPMEAGPVRVPLDVERMKNALAEPRATLPRGPTREEKRAMLNIMVGDLNAGQGKAITGDTVEDKADCIAGILDDQKTRLAL